MKQMITIHTEMLNVVILCRQQAHLFTPITHERKMRQNTPFHHPFILIIRSFVQTNNRDYLIVVFSLYCKVALR